MDDPGRIGFDMRRQYEIVRDGGRLYCNGLNSLGVRRDVFVVARACRLAGFNLGASLLRIAPRTAAPASGDDESDGKDWREMSERVYFAG
jgi:hypothetical protein